MTRESPPYCSTSSRLESSADVYERRLYRKRLFSACRAAVRRTGTKNRGRKAGGGVDYTPRYHRGDYIVVVRTDCSRQTAPAGTPPHPPSRDGNEKRKRTLRGDGAGKKPSPAHATEKLRLLGPCVRCLPGGSSSSAPLETSGTGEEMQRRLTTKSPDNEKSRPNAPRGEKEKRNTARFCWSGPAGA